MGLTGGMAAGKSEALAALERLGAATLSADRVVHGLYDQPAVRDAVVARWGDAVRDGDGVDRRAIAARVFGDDAERVWLEGLLWPRVGKAIDAWHAEQERRRPPPPAIVVEVPLLFEAGMDALFDATIAVVADDAVRAELAAARGLGTVDERTARQLPQADKARRADHVVVNSGTLTELERSLTEVLAKLNG
ncbi:MAG: Dephospho-CoA kinase [uncultured Solirubrobacteraceae bacterium]|uniref:Dephospho-CoA kinase n=1 Tax=uncultured Solirubrobacteraceae bacterium TaxID=1162706 RepID=A0A6J4S806_9ACTN|nr:MAG: Dephospho-CoA kinase [uncultured Solirubrobacteraceae bacterium]